MGAWGAGIFENDSACDFWAELSDKGNLDLIIENLNEGNINGDTYLEIDVAYPIIVCCLVVIGFGDRQHIVTYPEPKLPNLFRTRVVDFIDKYRQDWIDNYQSRTYGPKHVSIGQYCCSALEAVLSPKTSEAYELWEDAGGELFNEWLQEINDLKQKLVSV
jgi:hypothetical protein